MTTQDALDPRLLVLDERDNVAVVRRRVAAGTLLSLPGVSVQPAVDIGLGHKVARRPIAIGEIVLKYGVPIGRATATIAIGDHVHVHNMESAYTPTYTLDGSRARHGVSA